jgi:hypothetical protein
LMSGAGNSRHGVSGDDDSLWEVGPATGVLVWVGVGGGCG